MSAVATWLGIFLLYTNLPVVLYERGVLPKAAAAATVALLLPAVVRSLLLRRQGLCLDRTLALMLVFLAVLVVSGFMVEGRAEALARIGVFAAEGLVLYLLVVHAVRDLADLRRAVGAAMAAACLLSALSLYQAVTHDYSQDFGGLAGRNLEFIEGAMTLEALNTGVEDRARGPVDDPNRFAQILLVLLPLAFGMGSRSARSLRRHVPLLAALLLLGGVLVTYSRGAFLTLVVLCGLLGVFRLVRPAVLAGAALAGLLLVPIVAPGYVDRVASIAGAMGLFDRTAEVRPDGPTKGRTTEMLAAVLAFADHPVLGVGPGQYLPFHSVEYQTRPEISFRALPTPRRAHDLYAEVAAESGTLGLVTFMAIPLLLLRDLVRLWRRLPGRGHLDALGAGFALSLLAYLGTGVFLHLAFERYYWLLVGLCASAVTILSREARREEAHEPEPSAAAPSADGMPALLIP